MKPIVFSGHSRPIRDICFNQEDDLIFTGSVDRLVTLWSTETSERIGTYIHEAAVNCMTVTPDSKYLLSGDNSGHVYIWDVSTGTNLAIIASDLPSASSSLDLGVSDRQICATFPCRAKKDRSSVFVFNVEDVLKGKPDEIKPSTDNSEVKVKHYKLSSLPNTKVVSDTDHKISITKFLNSNKNLLCAFDNGLMECRDIKGSVLKSAQFHEEGKPIMDLDITPKEELALSSAKDGKSVLFDPDNLEILNCFAPENPKRNINSGKISPLFNPDLSEKDQLRHCIIGGGQESKSVTFTRATEGGFEVLIYDMITGEEVGSISGHFSPINSLAVSHSGKIIVSGGEEATVRVHNLPPEYYQLKDY
eukprot:CAMPEP_0170515750 /NCGR_PEP_ID=MMETSP0209-20121228/2147_1 /TAXON_ID=665100 ORGANISM="Litonotus pictus, Strain P1" /NCGR_SAMPLE_ID=MMETSP0209 /ASSEMBLY_ACC=CAM_ASM_000301 /LENGTH=361 /DNA_ID=CAMNT_0010800381 /DNA_START=1 /DNA_END=1086 /DNA_ORIENTATION=+